MSLVVKSSIPRLAVRDIICWKVVKPTLPWNQDDPRYSPPIMQLRPECKGMYVLGRVAKAKILPPMDLLKVIKDIVINRKVQFGFIHCYSRIEDIDLKETRNAGLVILECVIPKRTLYYSSDTIKYWPGQVPLTIASRKVKPIKIIDYESNR